MLDKLDFLKPNLNFFNFKSLFSKLNFLKGELSNKELIGGLFIPFSQLYFRLIKLNGSLDKPYLMLPFFLMFPLSILPVFMIHYGYVQKGDGGPVYDNYMYIPVIFYTILDILLNKLDTDYDMVIKLISTFAVSMIPFYLRESKNCKDVKISNILSNAALVIGLTQVGIASMNILSFVPIIGMVFNIMLLLRDIPVIGEGLIYTLWYLPSYMFLNVYNNKNGVDKYCNTSNQYITIIAGIVLAIFGNFVDNMLY